MKTIMVLCVLLIAFPVMADTFTDNFEDGNLDGWKMVDVAVDLGFVKESTGKVEEKDGNLIVTDNVDIQPDFDFFTMVAFDNEQSIRNFVLSVDANIARVTTNFCTLCFQFRSGGDSFVHNLYKPSVNNGSSSTAIGEIKTKFPEINYMGVVENPLAFEVGKWYHIKLEMKDTQANVWVDDSLILQADWKGQAFLQETGPIYLGGWGAEFRFDNFSLTSDDLALSSVKPKDKLSTTWAKIKNN